jgi:hypothetical protein
MNLARVFAAAAACVAFGAVVASCSGSFGSGTGMPQTLGSLAPGVPTPSPTPNSTSIILTVGESTAFQSIPEIGGYSAQLAFPKAVLETKAPSAKTPDPKASPTAAPTPVAIAIGATLSVVKPEDGPDLNFESGKGKRKRSREKPARALAYIKLLPTHDVTFESYPRITIDVPRDIASQYRDGEFGLALWNSGEKDAKYRLAVAELDKTATPPPAVAVAPRPVSVASAGAGATTTPLPSSTGGTLVKGPPGLSGTAPIAGPTGAGTAAPGASGAPLPAATATLPPAHIFFTGTAATLKLIANRPLVFALYALPHPATPAPEKSVTPAAEKSPSHNGSPAASGSPASSARPVAAAEKSSSAPTGTPVPSSTASP